MKKSIHTFIFFHLSVLMAFSQSNPIDKKMEKIYALVEKDKISDADESLEKLLKENPQYGKGWDYLSKIRYHLYQESKKSDLVLGGNMTVTSTDKNGKKIENDSLTQSLFKVLSEIKPSKVAFNKYVYTMRKGTLLAPDAYQSSMLIRDMFVNKEVDTAVGKKALKYFKDAEVEFGKKNYADAAKLYKRAKEEQPDFYKAALYMGDCYYFLGYYVEAISSFKAAVERFPDFLEPRKYLVDAYSKEHLYDFAVKESINALMVYPDQTMFGKLDEAAYFNNQRIDINWTPRGTFPNKIKKEGAKEDINEYSNPKEDPILAPWTFYVAAEPLIKNYCNDKGLITKSNTLTKSKYMEIFSWEEMLKNSNDPILAEARRMQKDGYLDCYVMIACFHQDFYDQYLDFVSQNREKILQFYTRYIVAKK